ncbi:MAG: DUF4388 domain-containing protein [Clostridia bacterium]|nr:DUF4388 domain-containing protein [Deltaproteobacteria bacterium]
MLTATKQVSDDRSCLVGQLETWPLDEILLWLYESERSAVLRIGTGREHAMLLVRAGRISRVEWGNRTGEDALIALFGSPAGTFNLMLREPPDAHANVHHQTPELLLQCTLAYEHHDLSTGRHDMKS